MFHSCTLKETKAADKFINQIYVLYFEFFAKLFHNGQNDRFWLLEVNPL